MRHRNRHIIAAAAAIVVLFTSCNKIDSATASGEGEIGNQSIQLNISPASVGSDAENAIRTLRVMIFSAQDESMLYNRLYATQNIPSTPPKDSKSYIITTENGYKVAATLPKQSIYILLVANEISSIEGNGSFSHVKGQVFDFSDWYATGNTLNIAITGNETTSNKGYIPMSAQSKKLAPYQWMADEGQEVKLDLGRNMVKVNLQLESNGLSDAVIGDYVEISGASVTHIPSYSFIGQEGGVYEDKLYSTNIVNFDSKLVVNSAKIPQTTNILTFYVPEYLISEQYYKQAQYAEIQINAVFFSGGEELNSVYKIPLGDGMQKLYDTPPTTVDKLTQADLSLTRNTEYNVKAMVSSTGKIQALKMNISIKDWEKSVDIDVEDPAPLLNISKIVAKMDADVVRVHFWTNSPKIFIESTGTKNSASEFNVNETFAYLSGAAGFETTNFKLFKSADDIYYPYNGYFDLKFNSADTYIGAKETYRITLNASGMKRSIDVQANPVVGEIHFNANGGTFAADNLIPIAYQIDYSELQGRALTGANIDVANPKAGLIAPKDMVFKHWSYSLNKESIVTGSQAENCTVTPVGYVTTVYANWE